MAVVGPGTIVGSGLIIGPDSVGAGSAVSGSVITLTPYVATNFSGAGAAVSGALATATATTVPGIVGAGSAVSGTLATATATGGVTSISALVSDFAAMPPFFDANSGGAFINGAGQAETPTIATYSGFSTSATYSLAGSSVYVKVVTASGLSGTRQNSIKLIIDATNSVEMMLSGGTFRGRVQKAGVNTDVTLPTYSATTHAWWRIREAAGTVFFDTSPDGTTWTNRGSTVHGLTVTAVQLKLQAGYFGAAGSETNPPNAVYDNLNTVGASITAAGSAVSGTRATATGSVGASVAGAGSAVSGTRAAATGSVTPSIVGAGSAVSGTLAQSDVTVVQSYVGAGSAVSGTLATAKPSVSAAGTAVSGTTATGAPRIGVGIWSGLISVAGYNWSSLTNWATTHPTGWITDPQQGGFVYEAHHYWDTQTAPAGGGSRSGNYQQAAGTGVSTLTYATELAAAVSQTGGNMTAVSGSLATLTNVAVGGAAKAVSGTSANALTGMSSTVGPSAGVSASRAVAAATSENLPVGNAVSGSTAVLAPSVVLGASSARSWSGSRAVSAEFLTTSLFGTSVSGTVAILLAPGIIPSVQSDVISGSRATVTEQRQTSASLSAVSGSRTTVVEIRQTWTDPTDRRTGTVTAGPVYFDASAGLSAASFLLEGYAGPTGENVGRLTRTPGTALGWGAYLAASISGTSGGEFGIAPFGTSTFGGATATIPSGTEVTISWWARGTVSQAASLSIVDDAATDLVGQPTIISGGPIDTSAWTRYTATCTLGGAVGWDPTVHRFRVNLGSADTDWLEWSGVLVTVGTPTLTSAVSGSVAYAAPTFTQPVAASSVSGSVTTAAAQLTMPGVAVARSGTFVTLEASFSAGQIGAKSWSGSRATVTEQLVSVVFGSAVSASRVTSSEPTMVMAVGGASVSASVVFGVGATGGQLAPGRVVSGSVAIGLGVQVAPADGSIISGTVVTGGITLGFDGGLLVAISATVAIGTAATPVHPVFVKPPGRPKREAPAPAIKLLVCETKTGRVVASLPFTALSWSAGLNKQTSLTATLVIDETLDVLSDQRVSDPRAQLHSIVTGPWRYSLVACWGTQALVGGPLQPSQDLSNGRVQVGAVGMEKIFERRILNRTYPNDQSNLRYSDPARDVTFLQTTPAGALYHVLYEALSDNFAGRRYLPIYNAKIPKLQGDRDYTWPSYDLQNAWKAMTDIASDVDGPDFRIDPVLFPTQDSGQFVNWQFDIGEPALPASGNYGPNGPVPWSFTPTRNEITRQLSAAELATSTFAPDGEQDRAKIIALSWDDTLINLGWPALEIADSAATSSAADSNNAVDAAEAAASVIRQAESLLHAHKTPTDTVKVKIRHDGTPNIGQIKRGDLARIDTSASIYLPPGFQLRRITQIDGSDDGTAVLSCERDDDLVLTNY